MHSLVYTLFGVVVAGVLVLGTVVLVATVSATYDRRRFKRAMRAQRYDFDKRLTPWED